MTNETQQSVKYSVVLYILHFSKLKIGLLSVGTERCIMSLLRKTLPVGFLKWNHTSYTTEHTVTL